MKLLEVKTNIVGALWLSQNAILVREMNRLSNLMTNRSFVILDPNSCDISNGLIILIKKESILLYDVNFNSVKELKIGNAIGATILSISDYVIRE